MYIVTGGAGFIGSAIARKLNTEGIEDIVIVDELGSSERWKNLRKVKYLDYLHKDNFLELVKNNQLPRDLAAIIHMGACSSTTERDADYMMRNNYSYTKELANYALEKGIRFIYASSAATYGAGENSYSDSDDNLEKLSPLNIYGYSKHLFDLYAFRNNYLKEIVGLKFFNVFGPNEYHKDDMRSVVLKSFYQIKETGRVKLFRSYRDDYADGDQKRDFIYIKNCVDVVWQLLGKTTIGGIYNLGTGQARSWNDLVKAVASALGKEVQIEYIEIPESIRDQYQYFTKAPMDKLLKAGINTQFPSLEESVSNYVKEYLTQADPYF